MSYETKVYKDQNGDREVVASGGSILVQSGGSIDASAGAVTLPTATLGKGFIPIDILSNRLLSTNAIANTIEGFTADGNTAPSLARVNAATDKALRLVMAANTTDEVQFAPVPLPHDLDDAADVTVHLLLAKNTNTDDEAVIDVQAFFNVGDTECGGATPALDTADLTEYVVTIDADDVAAHPGVLNISLVPGAHANDAIYLYAAWIEYTRKTS